MGNPCDLASHDGVVRWENYWVPWTKGWEDILCLSGSGCDQVGGLVGFGRSAAAGGIYSGLGGDGRGVIPYHKRLAVMGGDKWFFWFFVSFYFTAHCYLFFVGFFLSVCSVSLQVSS